MSSLANYRKKRDFSKTKEPSCKKSRDNKKNIFVIQKHYSKRPHFDFRIQIGQSLRSWAVPKGVPRSTSIKRLAMLTENHPLEYADFQGFIPKGEYGEGKVEIWDKGFFENIKKDKKDKIIPISKCFKNGQIEIHLNGKKLNSSFALVRFKDDKTWLLVKMRKR